jgi:hypothetical protein
MTRLARSYENTRANADLAERARSISRYLPSFSQYLPRNPVAGMRPPNLPRLPGLGRMPSAPSVSRRSLTNSGKAIVVVAFLVVIVVALWRAGGIVEKLRQARAAVWRLGPWPVRPEAVSTRGELVQAFEHLSLLCLGQPARTRNHLELAEQIAGQPSLDPDRRRDAAQTLADLYAQARYTPAEEPLPDNDLERARRELCYLAGVSAA